MVWVITLTAKVATLYRAQQTGIECLVSCSTEAIEHSKVPILDEILGQGLTENRLGEPIFVIVDQAADVLKSTPENLRDRRLNTTLLNSLEQQLLGQRRFKTTLRETPGRWGRTSLIRFYALEESKLVQAWVDALRGMSANMPIPTPVTLIPQVLVIESAYGDQMKSLTPVIYCHTFNGFVVRHTLYINGRAMFTRVPAIADDATQQQAALQLDETIDFLRGEKILNADVDVRIALPPGSSAALLKQLSTVCIHCVCLTGAQHKISGTRPEEVGSNVDTHTQWLHQITWTSLRERRKLSRYDLNRSARPLPVLAVARLRNTLGCRDKRHGRLCLKATPWLVLLCVLSGGFYAIRIHTDQKAIEINLAQIELNKRHLERYRFSSPELEVLLRYRDWLVRKPGELSQLLQWIGLQLQGRHDIQLSEVYWCWSATKTDCSSDLLAVSEPAELTMPDNRAIPETLMLRIKGSVIKPFESRRLDFESYRSLLVALVTAEQLSVANEEYSPHKQHVSPGSDRQKNSLSAREFSFVLRYQPLAGSV